MNLQPRTEYREPRTLLIDADGTLWENNIYFERVIRDFVAALGERGCHPDEANRVLWETEQRNIGITGYGSRAFCRSLHEVATTLGAADLEPWIAEQEQWICHHRQLAPLGHRPRQSRRARHRVHPVSHHLAP